MSNYPSIIAIDDGYAYTKLAWFDDKANEIKTFAIPSSAAPGNHAPISMEEPGADDNPIDRCYYTDENIMFTAGNLSEPEATESDSYPYSSLNRVIVNHALIRAGFGTEKKPFIPEKIGVSVPLNRYAEGGDIQERRRESLSQPVIPAGHKKPFVQLNHDAIKVFPEAVVAWVDHVIDDHGNDKNDPEEITAVVDIGGRTTDVTVFMDGRPRREYSGTYEVGILTVLRNLQRAMQTKFKMANEPPLRVAERAIERKGKISFNGQPHDVSDLIHEAKLEVADQIHRNANKRVEKVMDFDTMIFVGGGSEVLSDVLQNYQLAFVPEKPHLANARGMLKYMLYLGA